MYILIKKSVKAALQGAINVLIPILPSLVSKFMVGSKNFELILKQNHPYHNKNVPTATAIGLEIPSDGFNFFFIWSNEFVRCPK